MKLKTFRARTMADALTAVKGEFGSSAVILHTKQFKVGGLFGLGGKPVVEVIASDEPVADRRGRGAPAERAGGVAAAGARNEARAPSAGAASAGGEGTQPASLAARARALDAYLSSSGLSAAAATGGRGGELREIETKPAATVAAPRDGADMGIGGGGASVGLGGSVATQAVSPENVQLMPVRRRGRMSARGRDDRQRSTPVRVESGGVATAVLAEPAPGRGGLAGLTTAAAFAPADAAAAGGIERELGAIKRLVSQLLAASPAGATSGVMPEALFDAQVALLDQDVSRELADELIGAVRDELTAGELLDPSIVRQTLLRRIEAILPAAPVVDPRAPGRRVIALVGPTGVGKTTTIAKLAATFKLRHGRRVGLVTADTYRIAAVDQLRTYAEIISLPLKVAMSPGEMERAVASLSEADVVLIDTAGRSPSDTARLGELGAFMDAAGPTETHLVLSATSSERVQLATAERFGVFEPDRVILTKLDEAEHYGSLLNVVRRIGVPLSYVTMGQEVPDHIEPARADRLARLILDGSGVRGGSEKVEAGRVA